MRRLMWISIGAAAACGIGAYSRWAHLWVVGVAAVIIFGSVFFMREKAEWLHPVGMVALGIVLGVVIFSCYDVSCLRDAEAMDGKTVRITAEATDFSRSTDYGASVEAKIRLDRKRYDAVVYLEENLTLSPGDRIEGEYLLRSTSGGKATYHRGDGILLLAYPCGEVVIDPADRLPIRYLYRSARQAVIGTIDRVFPEDTRGFAKALLLGDRSGLGYETDTAFKISGISHVVAVSGLHISILFSLVYLVSHKHRSLTALIGIPAVIVFAAVAGWTPSITRACIMQILVMLALLFDREYDPPTALSVAVLVMLVSRPMVITSASFQLSVGCMAGIFLFSQRIRAWIERNPLWKEWNGRSVWGRLRGWLASSISVTISAMFFTTPLVAYYFGTVSLIGVLTNLLTLWVITFIFYGIMVVCLLSGFWTWGASAFAWIISLPIRYVLGAAKLLSRVPLAAVYTKSIYIVGWLIVCYLLLAVFLIMKKRRPRVFICCVLVALCVSLFLSWVEPRLDEERMTVLDVGQGQCILLQADGRNYLIDCGGGSDTRSADLAAETLLSQGIRRLDGVIVTHYDRDHAGGVGYLLSRIPADTVFLPETVDVDGTQESILANCDGRDTVVVQDVQLCWEDNCLDIFAPVLSTSSNESGLSVLFQRGDHAILITGDMSYLGERLLLEEKQLPRLTALVVGHHGSASSTGMDLLSATRPEYAFISVGADNGYGHPSTEVLDRLAEIGCTVYRTDENGTIIFRR